MCVCVSACKRVCKERKGQVADGEEPMRERECSCAQTTRAHAPTLAGWLAAGDIRHEKICACATASMHQRARCVSRSKEVEVEADVEVEVKDDEATVVETELGD